jgi:hypothetical protein
MKQIYMQTLYTAHAHVCACVYLYKVLCGNQIISELHKKKIRWTVHPERRCELRYVYKVLIGKLYDTTCKTQVLMEGHKKFCVKKWDGGESMIWHYDRLLEIRY